LADGPEKKRKERQVRRIQKDLLGNVSNVHQNS
jgi:hypothetical protein